MSQSGTNRRGFLKKTAAVAATAAAAGNVSTASAFVPAVHSHGQDLIKIGLVGCGGRGTGAAIQAMNTTGPTKLVAVADAFENQTDRCVNTCSKKHGNKVDVPKERRFSGFDAYKGVMESDCDLVILATTPGFRPLHFEAAVNAGKHIFMEKPVATDAPGIRRVLAANEIAKKKNLAVAVGLQRHHESRYTQTIAKIHEGEIGDILYGRVYWNNAGVWTRARKPGQTELEYQMRNWYYFNWLCGDHINEQHIHNIDVMNWVMKDYPAVAQGQGGRQVRTSKEHGEIFDHHFVEFTYGNGTTMMSQCRHMPKCMSRVAEAVHGTKGWCDFKRGALYRHGESKPYWRTTGKGGGHQQEHHDLFAQLRKGEIPNEGEYGAKSTMTAIMGRMATYTGMKLTWQQALNSPVELADFDALKFMNQEAPVQPNEDLTYDIPHPGTNWDSVIGKPV